MGGLMDIINGTDRMEEKDITITAKRYEELIRKESELELVRYYAATYKGYLSKEDILALLRVERKEDDE